jgi:hypothetical protein
MDERCDIFGLIPAVLCRQPEDVFLGSLIFSSAL